MSASIPPLPPARGSSRVVPSAPLVPSDVVPNNSTDSSSLCSRGGEHSYNQVVLTHGTEENQYQRLNSTEPAIETRLRKLEDNQTRILLELRQFCDDITSSVQSLQTSITEIKMISTALENIIRESSTSLQTSLEKMQQRQLENCDHLGKQIMEVRRDIAMINKTVQPNIKPK